MSSLSKTSPFSFFTKKTRYFIPIFPKSPSLYNQHLELESGRVNLWQYDFQRYFTPQAVVFQTVKRIGQTGNHDMALTPQAEHLFLILEKLLSLATEVLYSKLTPVYSPKKVMAENTHGT